LALIEIASKYEDWIKERVVSTFEEKGVNVTRPAQIVLAYTLQAQLEDRLFADPGTVLERAERLLQLVPAIYGWQYKKREMNVNRALHLVVEANLVRRAFPWGPSLGERSGSRPDESRREKA